MGNYGNHNRNILGRHGGFSTDEWEVYRENLQGGQSDYVAPGKTLRPQHYKLPQVESTVDEKISTLLGALNSMMVNKPMIHYQLGCAYKAKGDCEKARIYFGLAAKVGHSDAQEELDILTGVKHISVDALPKVKMDGLNNASILPKVKYFKITEIVMSNGRSEFLLQIDVGERKGLQPVSAVLKRIGRSCIDVFAKYQEAYEKGIRIKLNGLQAV